MKPFLQPLFLGMFLLSLISCDHDKEDSEYADYTVAYPLTMTFSEFKNGVDIQPVRPVEVSGKIYVYKDYVFVNEKFKGVHVVDNSNPQSPQKISFIKIPGNVDISVKGDYLYADSLMDLVVLDISDIRNIRYVNRMDNVLREGVAWPMADFYENQDINYQTEVVVGWDIQVERRSVESYQGRWGGDVMVEFAADAANSNSVGQGGSLARFKIVADYLYAVDSHNINVFDISDLDNPKDLEDVFAGFDIETIFNRGDQLFLGSMRGMYIFDISNPATPTFISQFEHGTACDPVVVDGDYAYVTLRGGNFCGATDSGLYIVDISDITRPELAFTYAMDGPYGLGLMENKLFVCDGDSGLKVYDRSALDQLEMIGHYKDITAFDVIPLPNTLLMVGEGTLYQYQYTDDGIKPLSQLDL